MKMRYVVVILMVLLPLIGKSSFYNLGAFWRGTPAVLALTVSAVYPTNGAKWLDYVKRTNNGGSDTDYNQPDTACAGNEAGYYEACIHGGEKKKATLTGYTSCANITITDALGAFDWECVLVGGVATVYSIGLKPTVKLGALILNATTWRSNSITVLQNSTTIGTSTSTVWWTNTLQAPPANTLVTSGVVDLDDATYHGKILVVTANTTTSGYNIDGDNIGFVVMPGVKLSYSGRSNERNTRNYGDWRQQDVANSDLSNDMYTILASYGQKFIWVEGEFDITSAPSNAYADQSYALYISTLTFGRIRYIGVAGGANIGGAIWLGTVSQSKISNIAVKSYKGSGATENTDGFSIAYGGYNRFDNIFMHAYAPNSNPYNEGFRLYQENYDIFYNIRVDNDNGDAATGEGRSLYHSSSNNDIFVNLLITASTDNAIYTYQSSACTYSHATMANTGWEPLYFQTSSNMTINQVVNVSAGTPSGWGAIAWGSSSLTTYASQLVSTHNTGGGSSWGITVTDTLSTGGVFKNNVLLGNNDVNCETNTNASAGFTNACANQGASTATWRTGIATMASSFVGKVTTNDVANASDTNGSATFASITDWTNFDNTFRQWGKDGSAFPNTDDRQACTSGTCRIWDWRVKNTDTIIRNTSNDGSTQNAAFVAGAACPAAVDGNKTITDQLSPSHTFLANAVEIIGDVSGGKMVGNDNGLCESGEACIYSPNFGAYQGEGSPLIGPCIFSNGTVTNVIMYAYPTNGG